MRKFFTKFYQFRLRWRIIRKIFTGEYRHFVVVNLNEEQFTNVVAQTLFDNRYISSMDFSFVGMCEIHAYETLMSAIATLDHADYVIMKAEFQADVDESMLHAYKNADGKR